MVVEDNNAPAKKGHYQFRSNVNLNGSCKLKSQSDWVPCEIIDIGPSGLQLKGPFSFYISDRVDIKVLFGKKTIVCQIKVSHIEGRKASGEYLAIEENDVDFIQNFIYQNSSLERLAGSHSSLLQ